VYLVILTIALVVAGIVVFTSSSETAGTVSAQSERGQKKYRATRRIVKDESTGDFRMPTEEETDDLVADLARLTKRPESLPQQNLSSGAVTVDLEEGFGGTFIARPNADGTTETRCVFTLEEALEFMGLVEDGR
jgi:hypothetical protein